MKRLVLALALVLPVVKAQPSYAQARHHKADPEQDKKDAEARDHYEKGLTHYNLGEFDPAVEEFKKAYELSNAPGLLFNIAQVYRAKEDYKQALYFYRTYLRLQPDAPNRADVEARIADLEKMQAEKQRLADAPPKETIAPNGTATPAKPEPIQQQMTQPATPALTQTPTNPSKDEEPHTPGSGRTFKISGLVTAGVGVALVGVGVVFGLSAASASDDLSKLSQSGTAWSPAQQQKYDDGQSASTKATAFLILGGAAVVGGGVLYYLGIQKDAGPSSVAVAPIPGGTAMVVTCRW